MPKPQRTGFYRGSAGRERAEEELALQKQRTAERKERGHQPFRLKLAPGNSTQFIVVDDEPEFYRFEHNMENPSTHRWDIFTGCVKEWDNCPVCEKAKRESYYAMYLTVIDFTPFETKDGTKVDFSKKLLCVKPAQQKKFIRAYDKAVKEGLTLRGALFETTRDGDKDSSIGNDIEYLEHVDEDELASYVRSWKDKDGKKVTEDCSVPFDYEALFEEPDTEALRKLVGGTPPPGNRKSEDREIGRRRPAARGGEVGEDDDGDVKWEKPARTERMPARRRAAAQEPDDDGDDDDAPPTAARRGARQTPAAPVRGKPAERRGTRPAKEDDDDDDDAPPPKASRNVRGRPAAREVEPEDDDDDQPEPPRSRAVPGVGRRGTR